MSENKKLVLESQEHLDNAKQLGKEAVAIHKIEQSQPRTTEEIIRFTEIFIEKVNESCDELDKTTLLEKEFLDAHVNQRDER